MTGPDEEADVPEEGTRSGPSAVLPASGLDDHLARVCLRNLLASTSEAIYFKDLDNRFILVSQGVAEHHVARAERLGWEAEGVGPDFFVGKTDMDLFDEPLAREWMAEEKRIIETSESFFDVLERDTASDNSGGWFRTSKAPLRDDDGRVIGTFGITRDVTAHVYAEQEVVRREAQLRAVVDSSPDAIAFYGPDLRYCWVNVKAATMLGLTPDQMLGLTDAEVGRSPEVAELVLQGLRRVLSTRQMCEVEYSTKIGEVTCWFQVRMVPHLDGDGAVSGVVAATRDLTELKRAQEDLAHRAFHDPLTGTVNRVALMERLRRALGALEREPARVALLFIDLDNFKLINDARGHDVGDKLLIEVASRLVRLGRGSDTVARLGGDEFVLLFERLSSDDNAYMLADRVLSTLSSPFTVEGERLRLGASIGVVVTSDPRADPGELLRDSDLAMYRAKQRGRERIELFHPVLRGHAGAAQSLASELRRAVQEGQFFLLYQPLYSLGTNSLIGAEALARWQHPTLGVVEPEQFIALAEELDLIGALGSWALEEACAQLARWKASFTLSPNFQIAVNVSARQLANSGFADQVASVIARNGLDPTRLCLEITETSLVDEWGCCAETLDALVAMGVRLALDDFGTGYSSLAHLHAFRVNTLKIDRHFVARLGAHKGDDAVVAGLVAMGHALGMAVVAEGVETESQLRQVVEMDCDQAQGFLFARPLSAHGIEEVLAGNNQQALSA
jgi:diguanylate cyclase (GGDEF)-like protein/PAS domain S-box-containing protein